MSVKLEPTISAAKMTYQVEAMRLLNNNKRIIINYIDSAKMLYAFPKELEYITSFYDKKTGSSGTLFYNNELANYILAFTGTNPYTDAQKDIETDIYGIGLGQGHHYAPCFKFYKKVIEKYGDDIILTGHSLGGNIAQRVAIEFNVPKTVIYNAAPLYIKNGVDLFMNVTDKNRALYTRRLRRYRKNVLNINRKLENFNGKIIHFSSEDDLLNRAMRLLGDEAVYLGEDFILKEAGLHSLKALVQTNQNLMWKVLLADNFKYSEFAFCHKKFTKNEAKNILEASNNGELSMNYVLGSFFGSEHIQGIISEMIEDVDMSKFLKYLLSKI